MSTGAGASAAAGPGRPRDPSVDAAILAAAIDLLCAGGLEAVTIEAVAARSGVTRPTVYRRHRDADALVEAAVLDLVERASPTFEPGDDPDEDVLRLLLDTVEMLERTRIGAVFRELVPHLPRKPAFAALANAIGRARRRRLRAIVERARAAGALPSERDLDAVIDGLLGAIYFRFLITGRRLDRRYVRSLLDALA